MAAERESVDVVCCSSAAFAAAQLGLIYAVPLNTLGFDMSAHASAVAVKQAAPWAVGSVDCRTCQRSSN